MINKQTAYKMLDEQYNGFWFDFFRKEWFSDKEMQSGLIRVMMQI